MRIYSLSDGTLLRVLKTLAEEVEIGEPAGFTYELEIDPDTNQEIVSYIDTDWNNTLMIAGMVTHLGVELTINPPGQAWIQRARQQQSRADAANIPGWASWTKEQALDWHDTNIADLLDNAPTVTSQNAVQVLQGLLDIVRTLENENRALVRMVLAMRNELWPELEGS